MANGQREIGIGFPFLIFAILQMAIAPLLPMGKFTHIFPIGFAGDEGGQMEEARMNG
jgi:hypothetical protein